MLWVTSSLNHFRTGRRIHDVVDVLASVIFGLMALCNLHYSIETWLLYNICPLSFFTSFNKNYMIIFTRFFFVLLRWLKVTLWYVVSIHYGRHMRTYVILVVEYCPFAGLWSSYISRTQYKEYCVVRCHKIGGLAQWRKLRRVQNFRGANFQYI
jgi:hypothetical protein